MLLSEHAPLHCAYSPHGHQNTQGDSLSTTFPLNFNYDNVYYRNYKSVLNTTRHPFPGGEWLSTPPSLSPESVQGYCVVGGVRGASSQRVPIQFCGRWDNFIED